MNSDFSILDEILAVAYEVARRHCCVKTLRAPHVKCAVGIVFPFNAQLAALPVHGERPSAHMLAVAREKVDAHRVRSIRGSEDAALYLARAMSKITALGLGHGYCAQDAPIERILYAAGELACAARRSAVEPDDIDSARALILRENGTIWGVYDETVADPIINSLADRISLPFSPRAAGYISILALRCPALFR